MKEDFDVSQQAGVGFAIGILIMLVCIICSNSGSSNRVKPATKHTSISQSVVSEKTSKDVRKNIGSREFPTNYLHPLIIPRTPVRR